MRQPTVRFRPAATGFLRFSSISPHAMPLILDTFNVLHTTGVLPPDLAGLDVPGLAGLIARSRYREERVTFVCDGLPPQPAELASRTAPPTDLPPPGPLVIDSADHRVTRADHFHVRYSGRATSADDLIGEMVRASTAPRRIIVISSDHAVQRQARKRRCEVLSAEEFLGHLAHDARLSNRAAPRAPARTMDSSMSAEQVERWKRVFNVDDALLEAEADRQMQGRDDLIQSASRPSASEAPSAPAAPAPTLPHDVAPAPAPPPLPADLIVQAEALWQSQQPRPTAPTDARSPGENQSPSNPRTEPQQLARDNLHPSAAADQVELEAHLADFDMNAVLPADDQTQPLRPRTARHRPPQPPPASAPPKP
jgi:hypothetical protein